MPSMNRFAWAKRGLGAALGLALGCGQAQALIHLRHEHFSAEIARPPAIVPPGGVWFAFAFDADVTPGDRDPSGGLTFYLAERDAGAGDGDQLLRIVHVPCMPLPEAGTQIHIFGGAVLSCDAAGRLQGLGGWIEELAWCDFSGNHICLESGTTVVTQPESSDPEAFELVLQDENRVDGSTPTPEDVLVCQTAAGASSLMLAGALNAPTRLQPMTAARDPSQSGSTDLPALFLAFDPQGTSCSAKVTPYVPFTFYVLARRAGIMSCGISAAEFRIDGLPGGWYASPTVADPSFVYVGDPLGGGADLVLPNCPAEHGPVVPLFRVDVLPTTPISDRVLSLQPRDPPINYISCVELLMCNPSYTQVCVDTGDAILNPSPGNVCDGTVLVQPATWSHVKGLYRD